MNEKDIWYLSAETLIAGERRGFSRTVKALPDRTHKIPGPVETIGREFVGEVVDLSDVHTYDAVTQGKRLDWPYRYATYVLSCNGSEVVRSQAIRPIKPEVLAS